MFHHSTSTLRTTRCDELPYKCVTQSPSQRLQIVLEYSHGDEGEAVDGSLMMDIEHYGNCSTIRW